MIEVVKTRTDREKGTEYYRIREISNWDLKNLYLLLMAEKERSFIVRGFDRGVEELLKALKPMADAREWIRPKENLQSSASTVRKEDATE